MPLYGQPAISRETRLLLITIVVAMGSLWVLARIRFQDRASATPAAVSPMLAQLRPSAGFGDLAVAVAEVRPVVLAAVTAGNGAGPALRVRADAVATLTPGPSDVPLAHDRATGLTIVRTPAADPPGLVPWVPRLLDYPRYLLAAELAGEGIALRPVFIGAMFSSASALWSDNVWSLPPGTAVGAGTFVFTTDGVFAGLVTEHGGGLAIIPPAAVLRLAERLLDQGTYDGEVAISVQPLSSGVAQASGAATGVVITAIGAAAPATYGLMPTDVIEAVDGQEIRTVEHWHARVTRLRAGETLLLRVRRGAQVRDVPITALRRSASPEPAVTARLGLDLRAVRNIGSEVAAVEPRSRAARAGMVRGDIITVIDGKEAPTPVDVRRADTATPDGGALLAAVTRGTERLVVAIPKP